MTDQEVDDILQGIIKLGRDDAKPGQVHDAIYRLPMMDGEDLFECLGGIILCGHPRLGKELTIKEAARMVK